MRTLSRTGIVLAVALMSGCDNPKNDDEGGSSESGGSESGGSESGTTTGEPDPCEGLQPSLPLFAADARYDFGQISISSCDFLISVPIAEELLVEGTDVDLGGSYYFCGCNGEWDCGYQCGGPTRVMISHVDEHCVVGTLSESLGEGTETGTDSGTDTGTQTEGGDETGDGPGCIPEGGFIIRR